MLAVVSTALLCAAPSSLRGSEFIKNASGVTLTPGEGNPSAPRADLKNGASQGITKTVATARTKAAAKAPAYKLPATRLPKLKYEKDPLATVAKANAPVKRVDENTVWGEWYNFKEGTLSTENEAIYAYLFNLEFPRNVVLQRRDAVDDPSSSQLRFEGFFEDYDFIINYNPETKVYWWDDFMLDHTPNEWGADTPFLVGRNADLGLVYSPKASWNIPLFVILLNGTSGFPLNVTFVSDDKPDASFSASYYPSDSQGGILNFAIREVGADVAQVRYGIFYSDNGYYYDGDNGLVSCRSIVEANREDCGVVTLNRDQIAYETTFTADKSGSWYLLMCLYDEEGDFLGSAGGYANIGLSEPDKWTDAGMATYTDGQVYGIMQNLIRNQEEGYISDLNLPDWGWGNFQWEVALEQNIDNPALYRLVNPYTCDNAPYFDGVVSYVDGDERYEVPVAFDKENNYYLIIDLSNPDAPFTYSTPMGIIEGGNNYWNFDQGSGVVVGNQGIPAEFRTTAGFFYDPKGQISSLDGNYPFAITLPTFHDYDYSFANSWTRIWLDDMGAGLSKIVYTFCKGGEEPENLWDILNGTGEGLPTATLLASDFAAGERDLDLTPFNLEYQTRYWLYAMSYDSEGNPYEMKATEFIPYAHEYQFFSEAEMRESTIEEAIEGIPSEFYYVEVYTAEDAEGHYFIRNPYAFHPYLSQVYNGDVETFMEIDCSDASRVTIPVYKVPLSVGVDNLTIQSTANYFLSNGEDPDAIADFGWFGKFDGAAISFPTQGTAWSYTTSEGTQTFYGSMNSTFSVRFPWFEDYTFTLTGEGHDAVVSNYGRNISHIVFAVAETTETAESELVNGLYDGSVEFNTYWGDGRLPIEYLGSYEVGKTYTVVAISVDSDYAFREIRSAEITIDQSFFDFALEVRTNVYTQAQSVYVIDKGPGVTQINFTVVEKDTMTEDEILAALYDGSIITATVGENGPLPMEYFNIEAGKTYVVAAVSLDGKGLYHGSCITEFTSEAPYEFQGTGTYTDAYLQMLFNWDENLEQIVQPREVEVYTKGANKDVVYVKEPFGNDLNEYTGWNYTGSRYMAIDISDPSKVYIPHAVTGIFGGDEYWFSSFPGAFMHLGFDLSELTEEHYGTLTDGKIVIPTTALLIAHGDDFYRANESQVGNLELVLPPSMTGLKDIEATDTPEAPAVYYDLSGRRIDNPAGGIYIVRRGTTVTKEYIR